MLSAPYFSQRDNYTQASRTCNSSACAMALAFLKPGAIANDDEYLKRVLKLGDSTDHAVQTQVLASYGLKSVFRTDLGYSDIRRSLAQKIPVVMGILHRGDISAPTGGHMILAIGEWERGFIFHDPWGNLNDGYASENGKAVYYSYKSLDARWLPEGARSGWGRLFLP